MPRVLALFSLVLLGGCAVGERGVETTHQPVVDGHTAFVPGCPDWRHDIGGDRETQSSNYGCASSTNLALMVADPADLLHGHSDLTSPEVATRAFKAWRDMAPTYKNWVVTVKEAQTGGK